MTISRRTLIRITACAWIPERDADRCWCAVQTDRTGEHWFRLLGVPSLYARSEAPAAFLRSPLGPAWRGLRLGEEAPLSALRAVPRNDNLLAIIRPGVHWSLGIQNDGLNRFCGPVIYAYATDFHWQAAGPERYEDPEPARARAVWETLAEWVSSPLPPDGARRQAIRRLLATGLFGRDEPSNARVFPWAGGAPADSPHRIEWHHREGPR